MWGLQELPTACIHLSSPSARYSRLGPVSAIGKDYTVQRVRGHWKLGGWAWVQRGVGACPRPHSKEMWADLVAACQAVSCAVFIPGGSGASAGSRKGVDALRAECLGQNAKDRHCEGHPPTQGGSWLPEFSFGPTW